MRLLPVAFTALALLGVHASPSQAFFFRDLGTMTVPGGTLFGRMTSPNTPNQNKFDDRWGFDTFQPAPKGASTVIEVELGPFNIRKFELSLWTTSNGLGGIGGETELASTTSFNISTTTNAVAILTFANLAPGDYLIRLLGTFTPGYSQGVYAGNLALVPIPAALWLFVSALAGLGLLRWRRSGAADA